MPRIREFKLETEEERVQLVADWLAARHCSLWAGTVIDKDDARREAAQWFLKECDNLFTYVEQRRMDASHQPGGTHGED